MGRDQILTGKHSVDEGSVRTPLVEKQIAEQARAHGIPDSEVLMKVSVTDSTDGG